MKENPIIGLILPKKISYDSKNFINTLNTNAINQLTQVKPSHGKLNQVTGDVNFEHKNIIICISKFNNIAITKLSKTANYLLQALLIEFNSSGKKSKTIILPIKKYMELRNLSDKKSAIEQITRDLKILQSFIVSYNKPNNKSKKISDKNFFNINICQASGIKKKDIIFILSDFSYEYLSDAYPLPINSSLFKLDPQTSAFSLSHCFFNHYNQNQNKRNANVISVKTLLQACPTIPERQNASAHPLQLIIKPFINSINSLIKEEILLSAAYLDTKGKILTEEQFGKLSYEEFIECSVFYTIKNYPIKLVSKKRGRKRRLKN